MKRLVVIPFLACLVMSQTAEDVARNTEARLNRLRSLQADFVHLYYSSTVSTPLEEKGRLYLRKPDLMKWEYRDPEKKVFLVKEGILWDYNAEDKVVIKYDLEDDEGGDYEILALLSGRKSFFENHTVEFNPFPTEGKNVQQLKLTPKDESQADTSILIEVDERSGLILKIISFDWAGNKQEFHFSRIKTDVTFGRDTFDLKLPPDVEIIEDIKTTE